MRQSFNVLTDPWIPVIRQNGSREKLGIRAALKGATDIREISIASPVEEFATYKLLFLVCMDALRPYTVRQIANITNKGAFDMGTFEDYFQLCANTGLSFDIFDKERPFMQPKKDSRLDKDPVSATRIDYTVPGGNNHVHWDHRNVNEIKYNFDEAFRLLLVSLTFMRMDGAGYCHGINGKPPFFCIVKRDNLFLTLCTMLTPLERYDPNLIEPQPAISKMDDVIPLRVRGAVDEATGELTPDVGFFEGMFFPARRVILIPDREGDTVSRIYFTYGMKYAKTAFWREPFVCYWQETNKNGEIEGRRLLPDVNIAPWRNYMQLTKESIRPETLDLYMESNPDWADVSVAMYGYHADKAKNIAFVRHTLEIPRYILTDGKKVDLITECLGYCDRLAKRLDWALRVALQSEKADAKNDPKKKASNTRVKNAGNRFYNDCEQCFVELISQMDSYKEDDRDEMVKQWKKKCFTIAKSVYNSTAGSIHASGKALHRIANGLNVLYGRNQQAKKNK